MIIMDITKPVPLNIKLPNVLCRHNISVPTYGGYRSQTKHIIIFTDEKVNRDFIWITAGSKNQDAFIPGYKYTIEAQYDEKENRLHYVKIVEGSKVEQPDHNSYYTSQGVEVTIKPDKPDALDVLLGEADYRQPKRYYL